MQQVERILDRVSELPFSPVAAKILELARDDRVGAREIARIIAQDQAFTARLLKIANSPYYGQTRAVTTVSQAVPVLGIDTITSLALALFSFSSLSHDDNSILTLRELWEHSMGSGFWARCIAKKIGHPATEETFIAGLLHDMGKALFYRYFKTEFLQAVTLALTEGLSLPEAEQHFLGIDHAAAGAAVARKWNLPPVLLHTIQFHHQPFSLPAGLEPSIIKTVAVVHAADALAETFQMGRGVESDAHRFDDEIWSFLGIELESCKALFESVLAEVNEFRNVFDVSTGVRKSIEAGRPSGIGNGDRSTQTITRKPPTPTQPLIQAAGLEVDNQMAAFARFVEAGKKFALLAGLDELFPNIANQAMILMAADAAHIFMPQGQALEVAGAAGLSYLKDKHVPLERSLAGWVVKMGEMLVLSNIEKASPSWEKDFFTAIGFHSHLFLPVEWAGKRLAVLCVHWRAERKWTSREISLLDMFAGLVAVALENARLYREAEDKAKALETLNEQLQEALHIKTRFLATVSHELRSPLFVITGYASLMADQSFGPLAAEMADALDKITKQANALIALITHILEMSQMDTGTFTLEHRPLDLKQLLEEVSSDMSKRIGAKSIVYQTDYDKSFPPIFTDRDRLRQILGHLLENAVKFTHAGKIVLRASAGAGGVEIAVEDTGIGIDAEHQKIIFDGFRQVEEEDNRRYDGLGLGLYLSRRIIELLGGHITVESEVGTGSRFCLWLPCDEIVRTESE
jgi:putative nucleotidyltransferase with HDIG domain